MVAIKSISYWSHFQTEGQAADHKELLLMIPRPDQNSPPKQLEQDDHINPGRTECGVLMTFEEENWG